MTYDPKDFERNPGKYAMFKTAVVAKHMFTENSANDLREGEIVGIEYAGTVKNALYRREEPIYKVTRIGGEFYGHVYANTLTEFVL